jgi:hypothetical protein
MPEFVELHVPGATSKLGALLWRVLPQRFVMPRVAASYRRALGLAATRRRETT